MDNIYGIVSSCDDYADKALMSPENLMMISPAEYTVYDHHHDHYQYHSMQNISNNLSSNNQYKTNYPPVFGQQDQFGFHCGVPSESVASMNVQNERKSRVGDHQDEQEEYSNFIKAKIASHPWYPRLVNAYIECQKVGAPPEIASLLDEIRRDKDLCKNEEGESMALGVDPELDEFMETFCDVLMKYKSDLSRPFDEASSFLSKIETQLNNIDKEDVTFSSDEELSGGEETETNLSSLDDPRNASKSEERELKNKLLLMYGGHIGSLKQEFSKKKKKGKLPKEARQALLQWWNVHFKWPYPTEADKISLGELTGLDQKQINNWFINQRKRHWKPSENMQLAIMDNISGNYFMD